MGDIANLSGSISATNLVDMNETISSVCWFCVRDSSSTTRNGGGGDTLSFLGTSNEIGGIVSVEDYIGYLTSYGKIYNHQHYNRQFSFSKWLITILVVQFHLVMKIYYNRNNYCKTNLRSGATHTVQLKYFNTITQLINYYDN